MAKVEDQGFRRHGTIMNLITDTSVTIEEVYEDTVELIVELDKLEKRSRNTVTAFKRLLDKASGEEADQIKAIGKRLIADLQELLK